MLFLASSSRSSAASSSASKPSSSRGGSHDPQELAKEWKRNLQKEMRKIDRDIAGIKREEDRAVKECKRLAKANQLSSARILAKQIAATRKTVDRMHTTKAQLNSVSMNLQASACKRDKDISFVLLNNCHMLYRVCFISDDEGAGMHRQECGYHALHEPVSAILQYAYASITKYVIADVYSLITHISS
ncbi:hypothetical protein EON65_13660 [archaeon]|nr:MAG: hypothetical protein EON65_13660 [archaeon]